MIAFWSAAKDFAQAEPVIVRARFSRSSAMIRRISARFADWASMHSPFRSIWNSSVLIFSSLVAIDVVGVREVGLGLVELGLLALELGRGRVEVGGRRSKRRLRRLQVVVRRQAQAAAPPRTSSRTIAATIPMRTSTPDRLVVPVTVPPPHRSTRS